MFSRVKPWWTDKLRDLWTSRCVAERNMGIVENGRQLFQQCQRDLDREIRAAKRQYWYQQQKDLLDLKQSTDFWKTMDRMGISQSQVHQIPCEVLNDDQSISVDHNIVLNRWKTDFEQLLNSSQSVTEITPEPMSGVYPVICDTTTLNADITVDEVRFALVSAKKGKALGEDGIPIEMLHNDRCLAYLVNLFNVCFMDGYIPDAWSRGIICPIIKDTKKDHRDPLNYRGITITSATYKLFCSILNNRLTRALELNNVIADEQNGFRAGRSTGDHISSLSLIIESRIKRKKDTFATFIDFSKAYDRVNRSLLWHKLEALGVQGKMLNSLKSLYEHVQCTIRINGEYSEWFNVKTGLKQGCILSPQLFNIFANDLTHAIRVLNCGLQFADENSVSILLYAHDIVLLSDNEAKMQTMLDCLDQWCLNWGLAINFDKSKVIHFRNASHPRTEYNFHCGQSHVDIIDQYKYLGVVFTEHLDFMQMSKTVAQSASRALGLLISKDKSFGGMPFECFTQCYNATVQAIIDYSAAIWGTKSISSINAVQNRACRYFLGLGRYAPNAAINGDMGWPAPEHRQWMCVTRKWCRLANSDDSLLAKRIFQSHLVQCNASCKTWCHRVQMFFREIEFGDIGHGHRLAVGAILRTVNAQLQLYYDKKWKHKLEDEFARRGQDAGGNKLRTYRRFKESYSTEPYVKIITQKKYRSAYSKFRCGVAPIKLETCRYGLNRLPVAERVCETCDVVEDECHVIMQCTLYTDIRIQLFSEICDISSHFATLTHEAQFLQIMSNSKYYRCASRGILNRRRCNMLR